MENIKIEVKYVDINSLKIDNLNPNVMSQEEKNALKESITKFGFIDPIITNKDLIIADGQHRWEVAKEYGLKEIPAIILNVNEVDRRLLRQILNKLKGTHDKSKDLEEFKFLLETLSQEDIKKFLPKDDIKNILNKLNNQNKKDDLDIEKSIKNPKYDVKKGEIYCLGRHMLLCGDSTSEDVSNMPLEKIDLVFTSPPYNMGGDYINFNLKTIEIIKNKLNGYVCWNISYNKNQKWEYLKIILDFIHKLKLEFLENIVWYKKTALPVTAKNMLTRVYENIFLFTNLKDSSFNKNILKSNFIELVPREVQLENHLACFPVDLPLLFINFLTKEKQIVYDPFGGSGSTLIACEQSNRTCYTVEIDPIYCSVILERFINYAGLDNEVWKIVNGRKIPIKQLKMKKLENQENIKNGD